MPCILASTKVFCGFTDQCQQWVRFVAEWHESIIWNNIDLLHIFFQETCPCIFFENILAILHRINLKMTYFFQGQWMHNHTYIFLHVKWNHMWLQDLRVNHVTEQWWSIHITIPVVSLVCTVTNPVSVSHITKHRNVNLWDYHSNISPCICQGNLSTRWHMKHQ